MLPEFRIHINVGWKFIVGVLCMEEERAPECRALQLLKLLERAFTVARDPGTEQGKIRFESK
jgi:hypothetical protein